MHPKTRRLLSQGSQNCPMRRRICKRKSPCLGRCDIWHHCMDEGPGENLHKVGLAPGSSGISLRPYRTQPRTPTLTAVFWNAFLPDPPSRSSSCRPHSPACCRHLKDGSHYPSGLEIVILDTCPIQLMPFTSV